MESYLCDVTLVCEDKQIKTHKVIISLWMKTFSTDNKSALKVSSNFVINIEDEEAD